jgi:hypothetical protein
VSDRADSYGCNGAKCALYKNGSCPILRVWQGCTNPEKKGA